MSLNASRQVLLTPREAKDLLLTIHELDEMFGYTSLSGLSDKIIEKFPTLGSEVKASRLDK